jgi:hypothetical protein
LARHRYVHPNRNKKLAVILAAGAFSVGTAGTATALTWPSGSASASTTNAATLTGFSQAQAAMEGQQARYVATQRAEQFISAEAAQAAVRLKAARAAAAAAAAKQAKAEQAAAQAAQQQSQEQAQQQSQEQAQQQQQSSSQQTSTATSTEDNSGTPQQIAAAMLSQFGWSSDQMSCLEPLWEQESGWSVTATNASSGAYGIAQALPASKMASAGSDWQTSAYTQIKWGLGYIQETYGSPCAAWDHEEADGWY